MATGFQYREKEVMGLEEDEERKAGRVIIQRDL